MSSEQMKQSAAGRVFALASTRLLAAFLFFGCGIAGRAQVPYLVDDINPGTYLGYESFPTAPVEFNGYVYFGASDFAGHSTTQLWRTDGTAGGTTLLKEVSSETFYPSRFTIGSLTVVNGAILFAVLDDLNGLQLWRSDGTAAGTSVLVTINPWSDEFTRVLYRPFAVIGTNAYFIASDGAHGRELWKSDGTPAGTMMVKDINPAGSSFSVAGAADELIVAGGALYFVASSLTGQSLWKSDGTDAGTVQICTLNLGGERTSLAALAGSVFFYDRDGSNVGHLYKTDGTPGNKVSLETLVAASMTPFQGSLYFFKTNGSGPVILMKTNGAAGNAAAVLDSGGAIVPVYSSPGLAVCNNRLYFEGSDAANGGELWQTDGTQSGTHLLKDLVPGTGNSTILGLKAIGNRLIFNEGITGRAGNFWVSDGTAANTIIVGVSVYVSGHDDWCSLGSSIFFRGNDANGDEPWLTDGTLAGTRQIADIGHLVNSSNPSDFAPGQNRTLFVANGAIWSSDGTALGTDRLTTATPENGSPVSAEPSPVIGELNGCAYFSRDQWPIGLQLWRTDGTPAGTGFFKQIFSGTDGYRLDHFAKAGPYLYFQAFDLTNGFSIFRTDGTVAGTIFLGYGTLAEHPVYSGGYLYYNGYDAQGTQGIMRTDGTLAGASLHLASTEPIDQSRTLNGRYIFELPAPGGGPGSGTDTLRSSDGTTASEQILFQGDYYYPPIAYRPVGIQQVVFAGNRVYFSFEGQNLPSSFWVSDGSIAGTLKLLDSICPHNITAVGNRVFFQYFGANGAELWISDGTLGGTHIVKDINPGTASSWPSLMAAARGRLYFQADDGLHGREFWISDGTPEGTQLLADTEPGSASFPATYWIAIGDRLIFDGNTAASGDEPWAVDMVGVGGPLIWADFLWSGAELGSQPNPYCTLVKSISVVDSNGTVRIKSGATAETARITFPVRLEASGGTARIGGL